MESKSSVHPTKGFTATLDRTYTYEMEYCRVTCYNKSNKSRLVYQVGNPWEVFLVPLLAHESEATRLMG